MKKLLIISILVHLGFLIGYSQSSIFDINISQPSCGQDTFDIVLLSSDSLALDDTMTYDFLWSDNAGDLLDSVVLEVTSSGTYYVMVDSVDETIFMDTIEIVFPDTFMSLQDSILLDCDVSSYLIDLDYEADGFVFEWSDTSGVLPDAEGDTLGVGTTGFYYLDVMKLDSSIIWHLDSMRWDTISSMSSCHVDTAYVEFRYSADASFEVINACYGDDLQIINNSTYNASLDSIRYEVLENGMMSSSQNDTITFPSLGSNGASSEVMIYIAQDNGCYTETSVTIESKLLPTADFDIEISYCENDVIIIENKSQDTFQNGSISLNSMGSTNFDTLWNVNNVDLIFNPINKGACESQVSSLGVGDILLEFIVSNDHGQGIVCRDTMEVPSEIHDVEEIRIEGLKERYCQNEDDECITNTYEETFQLVFCGTTTKTNDGIIWGTNVEDADTTDGVALFDPNEIDEFTIVGVLEDDMGCTVTTSSDTKVVSAVTDVTLEGLELEYCSDSGEVVLEGIPGTGSFESFLENNEILSTSGNTASFEPMVTQEQPYIFVFQNIDSIGCYYEDCDTTTVYPLPEINLPESDILEIGEELVLGVPFADDTTYDWSTGETTDSITINNPGIYQVVVSTEYTEMTTCSDSATIEIKLYSNTIELPYKVKIGPNPFVDRISITDYPSSWESPYVVDVRGNYIATHIGKEGGKIFFKFNTPLPTGMYFLLFPNGSRVKLLKI